MSVKDQCLCAQSFQLCGVFFKDTDIVAVSWNGGDDRTAEYLLRIFPVLYGQKGIRSGYQEYCPLRVLSLQLPQSQEGIAGAFSFYFDVADRYAFVILKGKTVHPDVSLGIAPGSKQVYNMLAANGALADIIAAGARILECACGPCIGMGQSPNSKGISLRTFNRNFEGRSGTKDGQIYLVSPETAAVSAIAGVFADARELGDPVEIPLPEKFLINDNMILPPAPVEEMDSVEILRGPNIKPFPQSEPLPEKIGAKALLKVGDNITTDHIMPAGAKILPYRSNIPFLSNFCFAVCDEQFPERCRAEGKGIIIGGSNYGQGSSREHAALVPLYLGIKAVIVKSFARIHLANLVNAGIVPLTFVNEADYDAVDQMDELEIPAIRELLGRDEITVHNKTKGTSFKVSCQISERQRDIILAGGLLDYTRESVK